MSRDSVELFERTGVHDFDPKTVPLSASERARIDATLAMIPPGMESILDVGCGPGELLDHLDAPRVWGTDLALRGLRHNTRPVVRSSMLALPMADDSVDLVLCAEVLEHLTAPDRALAVAELVRVARRHVLVTVPYREQILASSHRCPRCRTVFHVYGHRDALGEEHLLPLFPPGVKTEVRRCWKVRPYAPLLLHVRTRVFGLWKHAQHTVCPGCGNQAIENHEGRLLYRLFGGLNDLLHPRRSRDNWLLVRADL